MTDLEVIFVSYRISMVFLLAFQLIFLPLMYRKWISGVIAVCCYAATGIMEYFIFFTDLSSETELVLTVLEIVVVQGTAYILCCYRDARALFTGIFSAVYVLSGNVFAKGLISSGMAAPVILSIQILVHLILLVAIAVFLRWHYEQEIECYSSKWNKLCWIPALFYAVTYTLTYWPGSIYKSKENWVCIFWILVLMDAIYVLVIKLISQQHIDYELEKSNEYLETYAWGMQREAETLHKAEEKMRILRHDSRRLYQMIGNHLEKGEIEQIKKFLSQMDTELKISAPRRFCENITVNGVLSGCAGRTENEEISFVCEADVPKELKTVNEFELAVVISNLLENAIDAAAEITDKKERKVVARIRPVKRQLLLEFTNTFIEKYEVSKVTELPLSEKVTGHGYDLRIVKAFANKYHAVFQYSVKDGWFNIWILTDI